MECGLDLRTISKTIISGEVSEFDMVNMLQADSGMDKDFAKMFTPPSRLWACSCKKRRISTPMQLWIALGCLQENTRRRGLTWNTSPNKETSFVRTVEADKGLEDDSTGGSFCHLGKMFDPLVVKDSFLGGSPILSQKVAKRPPCDRGKECWGGNS